jgi:hypothetical protein
LEVKSTIYWRKLLYENLSLRNKFENYYTKMANFQNHPISIITSFGSIRPAQTVNPNHNRSKFEDILENLNKNLKQFDALTKYSIQTFSLTDDKTISEILEDGRKSLIKNFLSPSYLDKFQAEIRGLTSTEILSFVKENIGVDSPKQRCQKAIEKINNSSRNSENDEKFGAFLKRLKSISSEMLGAAEEVKTYFVEKVFRENLTPSMRSFLLEQNHGDKSIDEISKLLDKCEKFRKNVNLFQLQTEVSDEKTLKLTKMIEHLTTQNESLMSFIKNKFEDNDAEIFKLKTAQKEKSQKFSIPNPSNLRENHQKESSQFPSSWELNEAGFPVRCTSCGYRGHKSQVCRGTQSTCNICRRQGHIAPACPEKTDRKNYSSKN